LAPIGSAPTGAKSTITCEETIKMYKKAFVICSFILSWGLALPAANAASVNSNNACPVGLVNGQTLDAEFGPGVGALTKCMQTRHNVKVVFQLNSAANCYGLGNIKNVIDDFEITHGMVRGRDYELAAIVHSGGGTMVVKDGVNGNSNACQAQVADLIAKGVKFYFCQNTTRAYIANGRLTQGLVKDQVIDGVEYVTAGLGAIADFQDNGWIYVQP
jgi:intracellular sulfur oxidation DsrE/DsrF family protein